MKIGILLLATHKYKQFVQSLLDDIKKHFLIDYEIEVYLFIDDIDYQCEGNERVKVIKELIPSYRFPTISLYRYKIFTSREYPECSHLFYLDIDMSVCDTIGDEILYNGIVVVRHPGFHANNGGSWETNKKSTAYTFEENRTMYAAGGFNGGERDRFYMAMKQMKRNIDEDEKNGVLAIWHDESHLNKYISELKSFKVLTPTYCMVEQKNLRIEWGINELPVKIIALSKDHKTIRE